MKALCFHGKKDVRVDNVPDPRILNQHDVILRVTSTAICGSDLHLVNGVVPTMEKGDVLGHEFMGEVVDAGKNVRNLKVGDRVVVPFAIACGCCAACIAGKTSCCENSNPNAHIAEKMMGHSGCGAFGYTHMLGGFAGGQAEYVRVPFADVGPLLVPDHLDDEQVLFLSDVLPTGYMGAEMADIQRGQTVAVWGCGPVGQFAIMSAKKLFGAERVIAIDRFDYRLELAKQAGADDVIDYEQTPTYDALMELTGGRGPDACIDAVGAEAHTPGPRYWFDRGLQMAKIEMDRPIALRECIRACRNGGVVSVVGVYAGYIDRFPMGSLMNRGLTLRAGQCHVHRYMKPLLAHIERGDIDPRLIITHRLPLDEAPRGYEMFMKKEDRCEKVVLKTAA